MKRLFEGLKHTEQYSLYRPCPPPSLIKEIVGHVKTKDLAIDVGCGGGQSTRVLSPHFSRVFGTDVSPAQIQQAAATSSLEENVTYQVGSSEDLSGFAEHSADLVTCCQAIHWFDIPRFYSQVDRVLKPQEGILAIYGYHLTGPSPHLSGSAQLEQLRDKIFNDITGPYWTPERKLVDDAYTTIPGLPYPKVQRSDDEHYLQVQSTLADFAGYIQTWSGFQNYAKVHGQEAAQSVIDDFIKESKKVLQVPEESDCRQLSLPLRTRYFLLWARKP